MANNIRNGGKWIMDRKKRRRKDRRVDIELKKDSKMLEL